MCLLSSLRFGKSQETLQNIEFHLNRLDKGSKAYNGIQGQHDERFVKVFNLAFTLLSKDATTQNDYLDNYLKIYGLMISNVSNSAFERLRPYLGLVHL